MIDQYVESISTFSGDIDNVIWVVFLIVGFWFVLAELVFFGLIFKFLAKPGVKAKYVSGERPEEKRWVTLPHYATLAFDVAIIVLAIKVWHDVKIDLPKADSTVRVISQQWAWTFVHPGPDNQLDTPDDITTVDELHVEKDKTYHFELTSRDVLHSFSVPVFRLKQDAIPGRIIKGWFKATQTGQYDIQCTEICGIGHGIMPARIIIESPAQHRTWNQSNAPKVADAAPTTPPTQLGGMP
ncbi:MAG: cytochrome C oxidase subunit II [Myxococcaceae bacterium]|nr:cytochrome C oxidase subunit II [Myxococcaceae bacterium]MCA3012233.1 cytochrome C oxidase subunit II [Myxococcaceae bacterium]